MSSELTINIKTSTKEFVLSANEAKELYNQLQQLFSNQLYTTLKPIFNKELSELYNNTYPKQKDLSTYTISGTFGKLE